MIAHACLHIYVLIFSCPEANFAGVSACVFRSLWMGMTENKMVQRKAQQKDTGAITPTKCNYTAQNWGGGGAQTPETMTLSLGKQECSGFYLF